MRWLIFIATLTPATCATRGLLIGDAERGQALFQSLDCIVCHSLNGVGGHKAPDLAHNRDRGFSPCDFVALMWGRAPAMWAAMTQQGLTRTAVDEQQAADLSILFYAASNFQALGDSKRGRRLFLTRRCGQCHGIQSPARAGIRPVAEWESLADPIALAQPMWNHSGEMASALERWKLPSPLFLRRN